MTSTDHTADASRHLDDRVQRLLRRRLIGAATPTTAAIPRRDPTAESIPLSSAQERLWFLNQLAPGGKEYLAPLPLRLTGPLAIGPLRRALDGLVVRHEILRTRYGVQDGQPVQLIDEPAPLPVTEVDLRELADDAREVRLTELLAAEAAVGIDMARGPVVRAALFRLRDEEHVLLILMHHIACDGWSSGLLIDELRRGYTAAIQGDLVAPPAPALQYGDYAVWQREWLAGGAAAQQLRYWLRRLDGLTPLDLPTDRPRPAVRRATGDSVRFAVPADVARPLAGIARRCGATMFMLLLGAFQALLSRYSGQDDVVVGTPIAARHRRELEDVVGCFVNTLVMRSDLSGDPTFIELLGRIRENALDDFAHQDIPFERIVDDLHPERDLSRNPLFQVVFVLQNLAEEQFRVGRLTAEEIPLAWRTAKLDLSLQLAERPDGSLEGELEFATALFDRETIERLSVHLTNLLANIAAGPERRLSALPILDAGERARLLAIDAGTGMQGTPGEERCLHEIFAERARRTPEAIAVVDGESRLTYAEVNSRADAVAGRLFGFDVAAGDVVGIRIERSVAVVVTMLGVLKAGAAYLPIDPGYPPDRVAYMLADAGVDTLITDTPEWVTGPIAVTHVLSAEDLSDTSGTAEIELGEPPAVRSHPDDLAYVIYTSGSTGQPKGVMVSHTSVRRLFAATADRFHFGPDDCWALFHSFAFDVSVWEIWGALLHGGRLLIVPFSVSRSPRDLLSLLIAGRVTVLNQTPSAFRGLAEVVLSNGDVPDAWQLRYVIFAGEALDVREFEAWFDHCAGRSPQLVNMYGITETTVHTTYRELDPSDPGKPVRSPVGSSLPDLRLRILDRFGDLAPVGVPGEIHVGGPGLARGYLGRPELTAERFVPDPFDVPSARLYRSGDRARRLPDGDIEFLGRMDHQVKIRGFRIELGEIEAQIAAHPAVSSALVVVRGTDIGEPFLIGYAVTPEKTLSITALRNHLAKTLPGYMIPAHLLVIPAMPLTVNGKVDRGALPVPDGIRPEVDTDYTPPGTPVEEVFAEVWAEALGLQQVGTADNFFELGGDSIRAVQVVGQLHARGFDVSVQDLFRHQIIAELAGNTSSTTLELVPPPMDAFALMPAEDRHRLPADAVDAYPLSMVQGGMVYEMLADERQNRYHNLTCYRIPDAVPFSLAALRAAAGTLLDRHEILRTSIHVMGYSEPIQIVHREVAPILTYDDLRHLGPADREATIEQYLGRARREPLDLEQAPLLRLAVHHVTDTDWRLTLVECHAILDGWSHNSLLTELLGLYRSEMGGGATPAEAWTPPEVRFVEFVASEREILDSDDHLRFWGTRIEGHDRLAIPESWGDPHDPDSFYDVRVTYADLEPGLRSLARQAGASLKSVLLAAHVKAMGALTGQRRFLTGLVCNGRPERIGGDRVRGMFLNTVPFPANLNADRWTDLVRAVFAEEMAIWPNRRLPLPAMQRRWGDGAALLESAFNYLDFHVLDRNAVDIESSIDISPNEFALHVSAERNVLLITAHSRRLSREHGRRLGEIYRSVLEAMAADGAGDARRAVLSAHHRAHLLGMGNDTASPTPDSRPHELFAEQVARSPERIAVRCGADSVTYAELNRHADRIAAHLLARGVGPGSVVAICLERGVSLPAALIAVLKTGAAYLPLDPMHPGERARIMLADAGAEVLLVARETGPTWREQRPTGKVVVLNVDDLLANDAPTDTVPIRPDADDLAYVIYTSGSTGRPKGVMIPHRAMTNFLWSMRHRPGVEAGDTLLAVTTVSFDIAVLEIFLPLIVGASVVVAHPDDATDAFRLADLVEASGATVMQATPATWQMLRDVDWQPRRDIRALCGGERLPVDLAEWLLACCTQVWDLYGPTETTVWSSAARLLPGTDTTEWAPLANTTIYVLDDELEPVPADIVGELYIGGLGLARGYRGQPALTAERFVPDPHSGTSGSRLYRTGDRARRRPDGGVDILGRVDHQLKIRGYRIEPGEVEGVLVRHPDVRAAAVIPTPASNGDQQLTAYYEARSAESVPDSGNLRRYLEAHLPPYLVPASLVFLDRMPLTANGKIDRRRLPAPDMRAVTGRAIVPPRNLAEAALVRVWRQVLNVDRLGVDDDFFDVGGHSLLAMRAIVQARREHGIQITFGDMMRHRTVAALIANLDATLDTGNALIWFRRDGNERPLFCVHPGGGSAHWYTHLADELTDGQPVGAFEWPGLRGDTEPPKSVEDIADRYLEELREAQPSGPYRLLGWCGASGVAWEMAHRLRDAGDEVHFMLLDPVVDAHERPIFQDELGRFRRCEELFAALPSADQAALPALQEELLSILRTVIDDDRGTPVTVDDLGEAWHSRIRVWRQLQETTIKYRFRPYAGRLHLLVGDELAAAQHEVVDGQEYVTYLRRWTELVGGGVRLIRVPGDHLGVLRPPHVATLAESMIDLFEEERGR